MPYVLSPVLTDKMPGLWFEGAPFEKKNIYDINSGDPSKPPVHYNSYTLKPHSLTHMDAPGHIIPGGCNVDWFYKEKNYQSFFGLVHFIKLTNHQFEQHPTLKDHFFWEVSLAELKVAIESTFGSNQKIERLILGVENCPLNEVKMHDSKYPLTLSKEAAEWLVTQNNNFCLFGTSWKSTDFQVGTRERPIHKIFLERKIGIFECLDLLNVPSGKYFWVGFPLPFAEATEAPVCPVLFTEAEITNIF